MKLSPLVPELCCTDIQASLQFYVGLCGATVIFDRPEEGFAMIEIGGGHLMLDQVGVSRDWLSAELVRPFGRGVNFQIDTDDVEGLYAKVVAGGASLFMDMESRSYRVDGKDVPVKQFIVSDPDGYLLRFSQSF